MNRHQMFAVIFFLLSIGVPRLLDANGYDDQEKIRRAAERLDAIDKQLKREAKLRYIKENASPSPGSGILGFLCCAGVIIAIVGVAKKQVKEEKNIEKILKMAKENGFCLDDEQKKCIQCSELIKVQAAKCKYCGKSYNALDVQRQTKENALSFLEQHGLLPEEKLEEGVNTEARNNIDSEIDLNKVSKTASCTIDDGLKYARSKKYYKAIAVFNSIIENDDKNPDAYYYRAISYGFIGEGSLKESDLETAYALGSEKAAQYYKNKMNTHKEA